MVVFNLQSRAFFLGEKNGQKTRKERKRAREEKRLR